MAWGQVVVIELVRSPFMDSEFILKVGLTGIADGLDV